MIQSEDRIIAFIDILGFKELIKCAEKANDYTKLSNLIEKSIELFNDLNPNSDFQFTQFSDSFVLSCRSFNINDSMLFMIYLQDLINLFLSENILLRGGLTVGKLIHTKNVLMGPAMNRAYELESEVAKNPRVIIERDLFDYWETCLYDYNVENIFEVSKDCDEEYFIDYINKSNLPPNLSIILKKAYELINSDVKSLNEKGLWLMKQLENHLKSKI
jgi:hypothetical protein